MKTFNIKKILIPIDFSETAFLAIEHACFMAKIFKADLVLLHVFEKHWERFNMFVQPEFVFENASELSDKIEKRLTEIAENIQKDYGISPMVILADGNICNEIVKVSKENQIDLIIMGTHGVSGFEEFFLGSNAYKVVTSSICPVVTVQAQSKSLGFKSILLPIDNSMHSRQKVDHAVELAKHYGAKIHIIGLMNNSDEEVSKKFEIKLDQVQAYIEKSGLAFSRKTILGNNQAVMTLDYSKQVNADLIAIMTDQEETIFFLGAYAQQIVNHSTIPVMSIRPTIGYIDFPALSGGYHS